MGRSWRLAILGVLAIGCAHAAPEPTPDTVVEHELAFEQFVAGERFSGEELARLTPKVREYLDKNHDAFVKGVDTEFHILIQAAQDRAFANTARRDNRLAHHKMLAKDPADSMNGIEARLAASHDPVVFYDAKRDLLFTRHSVADLRAAAAWVAALLDVPGPTASFETDIAAGLSRDEPALDAVVATQLPAVATAQAGSQPCLRDADSSRITAAEAKLLATTFGPDGPDPNWRLAVGATTVAMVVDRELRFIAFVPGERLSDTECASIAVATLDALANDHDNVLTYYRNKTEYLTKAEKDRTYAADLRTANRLAFHKALATSPEDSIDGLEARIIARHDPVVAADLNRDLLFTRRSIGDLRAGAVWLADLLGVPGPTAGFDDEIAATLRWQIRQIDKEVATDMMHVAQHRINAQDWFQHGDQKVIADLKPKLRESLNKPTTASHNYALAQNAGTIAAAGARNADVLMKQMMTSMSMYMLGPANPMSVYSQMNRMTQQSMIKGIRKGGPACMSGSASRSWCEGGNE